MVAEKYAKNQFCLRFANFIIITSAHFPGLVASVLLLLGKFYFFSPSEKEETERWAIIFIPFLARLILRSDVAV